MLKHLKNIIKVLLFLGVGVVLFMLVYRDFDFNLVLIELKRINYWWFLPFTLFVLLSNISRTIRWQMLIKSYGGSAGFINTFFAVLLGYFANMALPRLGEVSKCAVISKYEKQPLSKVLGTMVSERLIDVIMLIIATLIVFFVQKDIVLSFIRENPEISEKSTGLFSIEIIIGLIVLFIISIVFIYYIVKGSFNKYIVFKKTSEFIKSFWIGLVSIKNVKNIPLFIFHSVFMWVMYFLMIYVVFPAFEGFSELDISVALTLFVAACYGMVAPAPNGAGAYHFMVSQALVLYGIGLEMALIFALVVHGVQTLLIIIGGIAALIILPLYNNRKITA